MNREKIVWEEEADKDGVITCNLRACNNYCEVVGEHTFQLHKTDEDEHYYYVRAVCTSSDMPMIEVGFEIEFDMFKGLRDVNSALANALVEHFSISWQ